MRMNEFAADRFASLYFSQDFGSLIFKGKKFRPSIIIETNIGYGELNKKWDNYNFSTKRFDKIYI